MSAVLTERLVTIGQQARALPHGHKTPFLRRMADEIGISLATLHRKLDEVVVKDRRKQRVDAGTTAVSFQDAQLISTVLMESHRRNGKRLMSIEQAVSILESNGRINTRVVDMETGEITRLSASTIARALNLYQLHPDQLMAPAPVTEMKSLHPNHVWQIDASLCVLYYLRREPGIGPGLEVMEAREFYKNKPKNMLRIELERVWRYVVTDHRSDVYYIEYVLGAESGENLANVFIHAIQKRHEHDPFHGVPFMAMLDPGSANTGAVFRNLCRSLQVHVQINKPGNPRAKGQVEKANDNVERKFESGLKFRSVNSLEELNAEAWRWMRVFNATAPHSRHKQSRYSVWLTITQEQLRLAPDEATCRELAHTAPESRVVTPKLTISFRGQDYDVSTLVDKAGVIVGDKVMVVRNPWRPEAAQVVMTDEEGHEVFHVVEPVLRDEVGFRADAVVIGERYARHPDTRAQRNAKDIELLATSAATQEEAAQARKDKRLAFGGELDPFKPVTDTVLPAYMPKRGTELHMPQRVSVELKPMTHFQAAGLLKALLAAQGAEWTAAHYQRLVAGWPEGVLEQDIEQVAAALRGPEESTQQRPMLALVS